MTHGGPRLQPSVSPATRRPVTDAGNFPWRWAAGGPSSPTSRRCPYRRAPPQRHARQRTADLPGYGWLDCSGLLSLGVELLAALGETAGCSRSARGTTPAFSSAALRAT